MPIVSSARGRAIAWTWRATVTIYLLATVVRSWKLAPEATTAYQVAQFAPVLLGLVVLVLLKRPARPDRATAIFFVGIAAYLAVAVLSVVVSLDATSTLAQACISALMIGFVAWTALARWRDDPAATRADLAWVVGLMAGFQTLGLALLAYEPEWATAGTGGRFLGVFENANYSGVISGVGIVVLVYLWLDARPEVRGLLIAAAVPLGASIVLTGSRTALVGCVAGIAFVVAAAGPRIRVVVGAAVAALIVVIVIVIVPIGALRGEATLPSARTPTPTATATTPAQIAEPTPTTTAETAEPTPTTTAEPDVADIVNDQTSGRLDLAFLALDKWRESPLLGYGFKTSPYLLNGLQAHNLAIGVLLETGIVGAIAFLVVIASFVVLSRSGRGDLRFGGALIAVFVAEMTSSALFGWGAPVTILLWLVIVGQFFARRPAGEPAR